MRAPIVPRSPPNPLRIIEILAFPSVQLLDVTGPVQVFASANDIIAEAGAKPPYTIQVVAQVAGNVRASAGVALATIPLSAGVTSGIDLALALVEQDLGHATALAVARYLVVFLKRPGGQAQFSAALSLQAADDRFGALHAWINKHLAEDISLAVLARQAGMSERSFSRRYLEETGITPTRAVEQLRLEAARRLLLESRLPVKRISQRCGFGSEETMRRSFMRLLAVTPQDYRSRFRS